MPRQREDEITASGLSMPLAVYLICLISAMAYLLVEDEREVETAIVYLPSMSSTSAGR